MMLGTFIIGLLIASIAVLSIVFLMVALRMGKTFDQMGNQASQPTQQQRHRSGTRR
jgi:phosphoglycerate-specific signal transduction histidine kinase